MSLHPPSHNAVEARCLAVIASTTNPELRRTAEKMLANGGRRPRRPTPGTAATPAPPAAKNTAPNTASNSASNTVSNTASNSASGWTCTTCTMLNEEGAKVCVACNRRRSAALPADWVCAACTVHNAGSESCCTTCEQPRTRAAKGAASKRPRCEGAPAWVGNGDDNDDDFV
eukprot:scaffold50939_cov58-Phaeocystis_antarctica.AAC.1